jgi:hypothetical protein
MPPQRTPKSTAPAIPVKSPIVPHTPETRVRVTLELPASLFDLYEEQAIAAGNSSVEDYMQQRLQRCREHTALKPIYMNDAQRRRLEDALEHNIDNADVAIAQVCTALAIQVGDVGVQIPAQLARRIATRIFRGETYESVIRREVIKGLSVFAGLLPG